MIGIDKMFECSGSAPGPDRETQAEAIIAYGHDGAVHPAKAEWIEFAKLQFDAAHRL